MVIQVKMKQVSLFFFFTFMMFPVAQNFKRVVFESRN